MIQWPDVLLACDIAAGQILVLDPEGISPPHILFRGVTNCGLAWTPYGLVSAAEVAQTGFESGITNLLLHRYPADPYSDTVLPAPLLDMVRIRSSTSGSPVGLLPAIYDDFLFAVTSEKELVRVELGDGSVSAVQTGVAAFLADAEGRYLLWQDATPTTDAVNHPAGKLSLRDRTDSSDVFLGQAALSLNWGALRFIANGFIYLELEAIRVFSLPSLSFTDLKPGGYVSAAIDERRWLIEGLEVRVVDLPNGEVTTLYRGFGEVLQVGSDAIELLQVPP